MKNPSSVILSICLTSIISIGLSSCDFINQNQKVELEVDTEPKVLWDWRVQKKAEELELGIKQVNIQPKQSLEIVANNTGKLTLLIDKQKLLINKDFIFAQMDREKLSNEQKKIEIQNRSAAVEQTREEEFSRPKRKRELLKTKEELAMHIKRIERIRNSDIRRENAEKIWGADYANISKEDYLEAKLDLELLEKELAMLEDEDQILYEDKLHLQKMEREEAKKVYDEQKEASEYKAAFSGELRIELKDYIAGETEYGVTTRTEIATLNDYEEMHAQLIIQGEPWVRLEPESLVIRLKDGANTELPYLKETIVKNKQTRKEEKSYVFNTLTEKNPELKRLSGTSLEAKLVAKLPKRCFLLNKVEVSKMARNRKSKSKFWPDIIDDIWPGAKVLATGYSELAVDYTPIKMVEYEEKPPNENLQK